KIDIQVQEYSPLPLRDPVALRELARPRISLPQLVALFFTTLLARLVRADTRKKIRGLLGRSYV
ncbi:MAG: methyltransferase type 11, partial [Roseiflexaceae bacterium]